MRGAKQKKIFEISDLRREILHLRSVCLSVPPPRSVCLSVYFIFSCICWLGLFGVFNTLNFNIFGVSENWIFLGVWRFCWYFWVITILDYTMHLRVFSEGQGTQWRIFFGLLKFQIFIWGAWNSWYFLLVNGRCWALAYVWRKNESTPLSSNLSLSNAYKWAFVLVGFCPSGLLS